MSRLLLRISLAILLVLVSATLLAAWGIREATEGQADEGLSRLVADVDRLRHEIEWAPEEHLAAAVAALRKTVPFGLALEPTGSPRLPASVRTARLQHPARLRVEHGPRAGWTLYLPVRRGSRVLVVGPIHPFLRHRFSPVAIAMIGVLCVVTLAGFIIATPLVRRLRRLERAAERISEGDLHARAEEGTPDAIGSLARRFNQMADRVQVLLEGQAQLLQAVSHELRTPTARIRFALEMLPSAEDEADRARRIEGIDADLTELDQLVGELLLYLRMGDRGLVLERERLDVRHELEVLLERAAPLRKGIEATLELGAATEPLWVLADRRYFRRAIENLLANAVRHARARVVLRPEAAGVDPRLSIAVEDDGPGVPDADRERIFEPFARLDRSRSRESGGVGLGLAIVQRIMAAHGGSVEVTAAPLGGARFVSFWPVL